MMKVAGATESKTWILGLGDMVEVLEPDSVGARQPAGPGSV